MLHQEQEKESKRNNSNNVHNTSIVKHKINKNSSSDISQVMSFYLIQWSTNLFIWRKPNEYIQNNP